MKNLDEIGIRFATDKSSLGHNYLGLYQLLFKEIAKLPEQRILEIGLQFGCSLKTWQDYFEFPVITGIDSVDNGVMIDRVEIIIADAYTPETLAKLQDREFDLIIDDGSHVPEHQAFVLQYYSKLLSLNGLLIIEDVISPDTVRYLKQKALPEGFQHVAVDMTEGVGNDSRLFIVWRK